MQFTKFALATVVLASLAACGGGRDAPVTRNATPAVAFATGPISAACLRAERQRATRPLCGCVQAVANRSFNSAEQTRIAGFFADPHQAQELRTADSRREEDLWKRYKEFGALAERTCRNA
ncbi:MAG: arginine transporter [Shimia sp.]